MITHNLHPKHLVILMALCIIVLHHATAQQLRLVKTAIASGSQSSLHAPLSATIGQAGPVGFIGTGQLRLYQGFEHPFSFRNADAKTIEATWEIFPNPAHDHIEITNAAYSIVLSRIDVIDHRGTIAFSLLVSEAEESHTVSVDISSLTPGAFLIKLYSPTDPAVVLKLLKL
jgi:hypothetical protein